MLGYEGNATFELLGKDLLQVRQRKGSWPIWITLQEEGTYIVQYILILFYNLSPKNILFQALVLEMKPASKNATSLLSGNTLLDADTKKMLCFLATITTVSIIKSKLDQKF